LSCLRLRVSLSPYRWRRSCRKEAAESAGPAPSLLAQARGQGRRQSSTSRQRPRGLAPGIMVSQGRWKRSHALPLASASPTTAPPPHSSSGSRQISSPGGHSAESTQIPRRGLDIFPQAIQDLHPEPDPRHQLPKHPTHRGCVPRGRGLPGRGSRGVSSSAAPRDPWGRAAQVGKQAAACSQQTPAQLNPTPAAESSSLWGEEATHRPPATLMPRRAPLMPPGPGLAPLGKLCPPTPVFGGHGSPGARGGMFTRLNFNYDNDSKRNRRRLYSICLGAILALSAPFAEAKNQ